MNIIRYISIVLILFMGGIYCNAQYDNPEQENGIENTGKKARGSKFAESRFFFGGNLGLSFGTYTYIEVAPLVGYKITPRLRAGLGPKYMYEKYQSYYETSTYGLKVFTSFTVLQNISETINIGLGDIFVYAENESLNAELFYATSAGGLYPAGREWFNITLLGGGMRFPIGGRAGFSLLVLWDVTQNPEYNYSNPELRIIFDF